jgi:hypothetical protein
MNGGRRGRTIRPIAGTVTGFLLPRGWADTADPAESPPPTIAAKAMAITCRRFGHIANESSI